jgi:hypothetical protein
LPRIQLLAQLALVDQLGQGHVVRPVDQRERDLGIRFVAENGLTHQQLVEIHVDQGPDDRVDLPLVIPDAGCDIDHQLFLRTSAPLWQRLQDRGKAKG